MSLPRDGVRAIHGNNQSPSTRKQKGSVGYNQFIVSIYLIMSEYEIKAYTFTKSYWIIDNSSIIF